jgi:hypothetical protein
MAVRPYTPRRLKIQKATSRIATVRPERGYSATNYDASAIRPPKSLRRQIRQKYDERKVRNIYLAAVIYITNLLFSWNTESRNFIPALVLLMVRTMIIINGLLPPGQPKIEIQMPAESQSAAR